MWESAQPLLQWTWLRDGIVATVLFLMALPLDASAVWQAIRRPMPSFLAVIINMLAIPLMAWGCSLFFNDSLAVGLLVAAATPCTLASASVWTRRAGGNDAISLIVTVVTNLFCFVLTPFWLWITTGTHVQSQAISFAVLGRTLALLVVLPMLVAQIVRAVPRVASWSMRQKVVLSSLAQVGILAMVFLGSVQMGATLARQSALQVAWSVPLVVVTVLAIHIGAFYLGWYAAKLARMHPGDQIAVAFAGSQKTLMVGLRVSMELGASILPMVAYHVGQLIADTILSDCFIARPDSSSDTTEAVGDEKNPELVRETP